MTAFYGLYRGLVLNTYDPEGLGRLKAQVPQVLGQLESEWAWPAVPNLANLPMLEIGDPVWIAFEGGDVGKPVWVGTWAKPGDDFDPLPIPPSDETLAWMIVNP